MELKSKAASSPSILVTGACGQVGQALIPVLQRRYGYAAVWASDIRPWPDTAPKAQFLIVNAMEQQALLNCLREHKIGVVYHLATLLSAKGEHEPHRAWQLGTNSLMHVLEAGRQLSPLRIFYPSSIAVCGPSSQRRRWPQYGYNDPQTIYGVSKLVGEQLLNYYHHKYGLDARSIRYPGLIGGNPGGGITDFACHMCEAARVKRPYTCFLSPHTPLPLMHIQDAIRGALQLMDAPAQSLSLHIGYNLHAFSCTPHQLAQAIRVHQPQFQVQYAPDERQHIARTWPETINDTHARQDWGWTPQYDLAKLTQAMLNPNPKTEKV